MGRTAFLDACVLYPVSTRDFLLRGAERYLYCVCWSPEVLEEARRNLVEHGRCTPEKADALIAVMADVFPEALVTGYDGLIPSMKNDEADRHVLAAAVAAGADVIVTENVKHFPIAACEPLGIEIQTADEFLSFSFDLAPEAMGDVFLQQLTDWNRPAMDATSALSTLDERLPQFSKRLQMLPRVRAAAGLP